MNVIDNQKDHILVEIFDKEQTPVVAYRVGGKSNLPEKEQECEQN